MLADLVAHMDIQPGHRHQVAAQEYGYEDEYEDEDQAYDRFDNEYKEVEEFGEDGVRGFTSLGDVTVSVEVILLVTKAWSRIWRIRDAVLEEGLR